jgi:hypothetical protein
MFLFYFPACCFLLLHLRCYQNIAHDLLELCVLFNSNGLVLSAISSTGKSQTNKKSKELGRRIGNSQYLCNAVNGI